MPAPEREPAYLRIASDLRRRIRDGSLRPGQRVPSTRRLAKTWKVALATASKALGLLVQEGLLRTAPRVGNVVMGPALRETREGSKNSRSLTRASIVQAAIEMADQEGLSALSMRGVAAKMGWPVTSLYRHIAKKEELLHLMLDAAMREQLHPPPHGDWRARVQVGARLVWQLARRHPWSTRVLTLTRPIPSAVSLTHAEWMLSALREAGADAVTAMQMHVTLYAYVQGLATNLESEAEAQGETGVDEEGWMQSRGLQFAALAETGAFPTFARILGELRGGFDLDLDRLFEFGLRLLLDGFARALLPDVSG
ncbi:MAG: TetR/AcrR family transcriptional regulator C-terminal domain-containing protein [Polyangiaceae bacterium]